jgi:hypothetical protein
MLNECTSIVIVSYPNWAGGKFLINCLALSNYSYFQDIDLVYKQRNNQLPPSEKLSLLENRIDVVEGTNKLWPEYISGTWNDLGMGCFQLFNNPVDPTKFNSLIFDISKESNLFFVVAHNEHTFRKLINIWKNAKIIHFDKNNKFLNWRLGKSYTYSTVPQYMSAQQNTNELYYWNADCFLDKDVFLSNIQDLYQNLKLPDFNKDYIEKYYNRYIQVLENIK